MNPYGYYGEPTGVLVNPISLHFHSCLVGDGRFTKSGFRDCEGKNSSIYVVTFHLILVDVSITHFPLRFCCETPGIGSLPDQKEGLQRKTNLFVPKSVTLLQSSLKLKTKRLKRFEECKNRSESPRPLKNLGHVLKGDIIKVSENRTFEYKFPEVDGAFLVFSPKT